MDWSQAAAFDAEEFAWLWGEYERRVEWSWRAMNRTTLVCVAVSAAPHVSALDSSLPDLVRHGLIVAPLAIVPFGAVALWRELRSLDRVKTVYLNAQREWLKARLGPEAVASPVSYDFKKVCLIWMALLFAAVAFHVAVYFGAG